MSRIVFLIAFFINTNAFADYEFEDVSSSDLKKVVKELGNNFTYTPVAGASTLGSIFGFKLGVIAGTTSTPEIADLAGSEASIVHAALMGRISVPFGLTFGLNYIPATSLGTAKIGLSGLEVQWTISEGLLVIPFDLAVRGTYSKASFGFTQDVTSPTAGTADVTADITTTSLAVLGGLDLIVVKPYAGVGTVTVDGKVDLEGNYTFFGGDLTGETSASEKVTGTQILLGVDFSLLIMDIGIEYATQLDSSRFTAKVAFGF